MQINLNILSPYTPDRIMVNPIRKLYPVVLAGVCALFWTQCTKSHSNPPTAQPTVVKPPKSIQVIEGANLVGGVNLELPDSIIVRIIPNDPSDAEKYFFTGTYSDSAGSLKIYNAELDSGGVNVPMFWQTGKGSPNQQIKFYVYAKCATRSCPMLDSVTISAVIRPRWTQVFSSYGTLTDLRFTSNQSALAVGNYNTGIVRTNDGGVSWSVGPAFRNDLYQLCFRDSLNGFVTVSNNFAYYTSDGGKTFTQGSWTVPIIGDQASRDFAMVSPSTIYSVGGKGTIVKSVDSGKSWQKYPGFSFINGFFALSCLDSNNCFACGEAGKMVKTSNGGQDWQSMDINLNNQLWSIYFLTRDIGFAGGENGVLIRTTDGGSTWSPIRMGLHNTISSIRFFDMLHGVVVSWTGEIGVTSDGGNTWQKVCPASNGVNQLQKVAYRDANTVFAIQNGFIYKYDLTK